MTWPLAIRVFSWIWRRWLVDGRGVVKVTGWRSCLYDSRWGQRTRAQFVIFPWEKRQ